MSPKMRLLPLVLLLATAMVPPRSPAQPSATGSGVANHGIGISLSSDAMATLRLAYSYSLPATPSGPAARIGASLELPLFLLTSGTGFENFGIGVDAAFAWSPVPWLRFGARPGLRASLQSGVLGRFFGLGLVVGIDAFLVPGGRPGALAVGPTVRWEQSLATHITHSAFVAETFPPEAPPRSGWFPSTASRIGAGIGLDVGDGDLVEFGTRLLVMSPGSALVGLMDGFAFGLLPFHLELGLRIGLLTSDAGETTIE